MVTNLTRSAHRRLARSRRAAARAEAAQMLEAALHQRRLEPVQVYDGGSYLEPTDCRGDGERMASALLRQVEAEARLSGARVSADATSRVHARPDLDGIRNELLDLSPEVFGVGHLEDDGAIVSELNIRPTAIAQFEASHDRLVSRRRQLGEAKVCTALTRSMLKIFPA